MSGESLASAVPPCIHDHARWKLVSRRFAGARISILSCMHCDWIDTEAAIEDAQKLSPVPELIAACKLALEPDGDLRGVTRRGKIREAIAKAESES